MKKFLILILAFGINQGFAQKVAVQTAYNYLRYDELAKAKEAIDGAANTESTAASAKTWYYRGTIYQSIYESTKEQFAALKPGSLEQARISFEKALELDTKKEFSDDIMKSLKVMSVQFLNDGVDMYKVGKFDEAKKNFETSASLGSKYLNKIDTLALYNAGLAAEKSGDKASAKKYFSQMTDLKYGGSKMYSLLANIYLDDKDTATALVIINKGRQNYPDDKNLIIQGLNIYLLSGKDKEAFDQLDAALTKDPENPELNYAKGTVADKLGKQELAAESYKKAIKLKPDYFDAYYNLGAMYFNIGAEMSNKANSIPANKVAEYDAAKKNFEAKFKEAQPYLEKAHELNPKDMPTMVSLKQLYARLGDLPKADAIKKEMEATH